MGRNTSENETSRQLEFVLVETSRLMARIYDRHYRQSGISGNQGAALIHLSRSPVGMSQSELADRLGISKAPAGKLIDFLEANNLVERERSMADRRVQVVAITATGMEVVREIEATSEDLRQAVREGTTKEGRRQALEVLDRVRENLLRLEP